MSKFIDAIRNEIKDTKKTQPVQGYIPVGSIDPILNIARVVRVPSSTLQTPDIGYLEYKSVPLPTALAGIFHAIPNLFEDIGVTVGFKGGNQAFPFIINFINVAHVSTTRENYKVGAGRSGALADKIISPATPSMLMMRRSPEAIGGGSILSTPSPSTSTEPRAEVPPNAGRNPVAVPIQPSSQSMLNIQNKSKELLEKTNPAYNMLKELREKQR